MPKPRCHARVAAGKYGATRLSGESMKTMFACLCGLLLSATGVVRAEDGEFNAQEKLMLISLNEINMTTATVTTIFEYCMKQDPGFSARSLDALNIWKSRNMAFVDLSPMLHNEAMVVGLREGMTRAEVDQALDDAANEVARTFPDMLDAEPDIARRIHVCDTYVDKITQGDLDIASGDNDAEKLGYLKGRLEAARR